MIARPPLLVPLAAMAALVALAGLVLAGWAPLADVDTALSEEFRWYGTPRPRMISLLRVATDTAGTAAFLLAGLLVTLLLLRRDQRTAAAFCAVVTAVIPLLWWLGHTLLHRPRPVDGFILVNSNGFPSGHSSNAAAMALMVVLLLWPRQTRTARVGTVLAAGSFAVFIGVTRVALLAHWPSDVLGGWLLALGVVGLAARWAPARYGRSAVPRIHHGGHP